MMQSEFLKNFVDEWNCLSTQVRLRIACYAISFVINEIALAVAKESSHVSGSSLIARMMQKLGPVIHKLHRAHDIASIVALKKVGEGVMMKFRPFLNNFLDARQICQCKSKDEGRAKMAMMVRRLCPRRTPYENAPYLLGVVAPLATFRICGWKFKITGEQKQYTEYESCA